MVSLLVHFGFDEARVLGSDMLSFNARLESASRILASERSNDTVSHFVAAQGTAKAVKDYLKPYEKTSRIEKPKGDSKAFAKRFGKGF